jgi:Chaperone of endosialidase
MKKVLLSLLLALYAFPALAIYSPTITQVSNRLLIDPRSYGAVCAGATFGSSGRPVEVGSHDDTVGIQTAAGVAYLNGGAVLIPDGCWVSTVNNIPPGTAFVGQGWAPNYGYDYGYQITGFNLTAGSGYTNGTYALTPSPNGGGSGFVGTITISGGHLSSTNIISNGSGYSNATTFAIPTGAGVGSGGAIQTIFNNGGQPFTRPVLYEIAHPARVFDIGATENVAFFGFEINANADPTAFGATDCIGASIGSSGFGAKDWLETMSMKGCNYGLNGGSNGNIFLVSHKTDFGGNNNGLGGSLSDFFSSEDTCASVGTCYDLTSVSFARLENDRLEFMSVGVRNGFAIDMVNTQFDHADLCGIQLSNYSQVSMTGGAMRGSGQAGSLRVTGTASDGGLIQLTVDGNDGPPTSGLVTGDKITVAGVGGTTEANGSWTLTVIDGTHIDLQGSTFTNPFTSVGYGGVWGKDADVCLSAGSTSTGVTFHNVQFFSTTWFGTPNIAPAYIVDTTTNHNQAVEFIGGYALPAGSTPTNDISYSIGFANWETFGVPTNTNIQVMGQEPIVNYNNTMKLNVTAGAAVDLSGTTGALALPKGTTSQEPLSPSPGWLRWNTTLPQLEVWNGSVWSGAGAVNWPPSGSIVLSNGTNSPAGLSESDGQCAVGAGGVWTTGSCSGTSSQNLGTSISATSPQRSGQATTGLYSSGSGHIDMAVVTAGQIADFSAGGEVLTGTGSNCLTVGANGSTNPVLQVDCSASSVATGVAITGKSSGNGVQIAPLDSGGFSYLNLAGLGGGGVNITPGGIGTQPNLQINDSAGGSLFFTTTGESSSANPKVLIQPGTGDFGLTASTEANIVYFNGAHAGTRSWNTGALALQRDFRFDGATDDFIGTSTLTTGATIGLTLKSCGNSGNATCTNEAGIYIPSTSVSGTVTNAYNIWSIAPTGPTNNFAARLDGHVQMVNLATASGSETSALCEDGSGNVIADSVTCISSSARFKDIISPYSGGLKTIMQLQVERYKYKDDFLGNFKNDPNHSHEQIGLIAENVAQVESDLALYEKDGVTPRAVRYEHVTAALVEAVQEQQKEIYLLFFISAILGAGLIFIINFNFRLIDNINKKGETKCEE